jgi:hypothetical protein
MAKFLLWNVGKTKQPNLDSLVVSLVREHSVDVLLLVEFHPTKTGSQLSTLLIKDGLVRWNRNDRFGVFGRDRYGFDEISVVGLGERAEFWNWYPTPGTEGRFVLVHGPDRLNNNDSTRRVFFRRIADAIRAQEANTHRRTIVLGDFNAHPHESAVLSSDGLHAIGVRTVGGLSNRKLMLSDDRVDYFYNPMWRLYGGTPASDAGAATYYWQRNQAAESMWHMLDQLVVRPEEIPHLPEGSLRILTCVGGVELVDEDGRPDTRTGSDHLPLMFEWNV